MLNNKMVFNVVKMGDNNVPELEKFLVPQTNTKNRRNSSSSKTDSNSESVSGTESETESDTSDSGTDSDSDSSDSSESSGSKPMSVKSNHSCRSVGSQEDNMSINEEEILRKDALYFILSKFFMSKDKSKNIVDVLLDIQKKLG
jgi:hypothetical protein